MTAATPPVTGHGAYDDSHAGPAEPPNPRYVAVTPRAPAAAAPAADPAAGDTGETPRPATRGGRGRGAGPVVDEPRPPRSARRTAAASDAPAAGWLATGTDRAMRFAGRQALRAARRGARGAAAHPGEFTPLAVAGGEYAAGLLEQQLAPVYGVLAALLVVAGYLVMRATRDRRARRTVAGRLRRAYRALLAWAAGAWLLLAAITSPAAPWTLRLYLLGAASATLAYWARHASAWMRPAPGPAPEPEADENAARNAAFAAWWARHFDPERGALAGSYLIDLNCDQIADRALIQLDPHRDTTANAQRARTMIAALRRTSAENVVILPALDQREDQARIFIYKSNPLRRVSRFAGPEIDYATGRARVGVHADGTGAYIRLWRPGSGTLHEIVCGASDAGKSRYVDLCLALERACLDPATGRPLIVSYVADPQQGQSLPEWQDKVARFETDPEATLWMLEDVYAEMLRRNTELAQMRWVDKRGHERTGKSIFEPTPEMPIISVTLEEAPELLKIPRAVELLEKILKLARKTGVRLRLIAQIPSIAELGASFTLRPLLASMNVVALRTAGSLTDNVFNLPGDPGELPRIWPDGSSTAGLCYLGEGAGSAAAARILYLDDEDLYDWATRGQTARLPYEPARAPRPEAAAAAADQDAGEVESEDGAHARNRIVRYLTTLGKPATSRMIVNALELRPSTVSKALKQAARHEQLVRVRHGVWCAPGIDLSDWADAPLDTAAA